MMSLKMQIFSLIYEIANSQRFILFYLTLLLGHFTARLVYCRNTLPLGYFPQKHFIAGLRLTACFLIMLTCLLQGLFMGHSCQSQPKPKAQDTMNSLDLHRQPLSYALSPLLSFGLGPQSNINLICREGNFVVPDNGKMKFFEKTGC